MLNICNLNVAQYVSICATNELLNMLNNCNLNVAQYVSICASDVLLNMLSICNWNVAQYVSICAYNVLICSITATEKLFHRFQYVQLMRCSICSDICNWNVAQHVTNVPIMCWYAQYMQLKNFSKRFNMCI